MRICASVDMILFRSRTPSPSSLLSSNNRFICRPGTVAGNLRDCIVFPPNDSNIAPGVCGVGNLHQQEPQLDERCQINAWRADCHRGTNHRVEHPTGDRYNDVGWSLYLQKLPGRSLLHAAHQNLLAEIGVIQVVNFQLLPDMGKMNG